MKSMMKKTATLLMVCVLSLAPLGMMPVYAADVSDMQADAKELFGVEFVLNEQQALEEAGNILDMFPTNRLGYTVFPAAFGGMYINSDGNLVVLFAENVDSEVEGGHRSDYGFRGVLFQNPQLQRYVEFSYSDLNEVFERLVETLNERNELAISGRMSICRYQQNITFASVDVQANRVLIGLEVYSEEMIEGFRRYIFDSPMIVFEQREPSILFYGVVYEPYPNMPPFCCNNADICFNCDIECDCVDMVNSPCDCSEFYGIDALFSQAVNPANMIERWETRGVTRHWFEGSVGFRVAQRPPSHMPGPSTVGFITAAHVFPHRNDNVYLNRSVIGRVDDSVFNGAMDAAFVAHNNVTNTLPNGATLGTHVVPSNNNFIQGQSIMAFGQRTQFAGGTILNNNAMLPVIHPITGNRFYLSGMVNTNMRMVGGDSGGPVFTPVMHTAGIITGGIAGTSIFFTPAHRIMRDLRAERF